MKQIIINTVLYILVASHDQIRCDTMTGSNIAGYTF